MIHRVRLRILKLLLPNLKIEPSFKELFNNEISKIRGWLSFQEGFVLYKAAKTIKSYEQVIEIGTHEGRSTICIGSGLKVNHEGSQNFYSIDPHTGDITEVSIGREVDTWQTFMSNVKKYNLQEVIKPMRLTSDAAAKFFFQSNVGLLFIDGWHTYDQVKKDIINYLPFTTPESIVIFDDWRQPQILRAILEKISELPSCIGFVGKDLIFSNNSQFNYSRLGRTIKARSRIIQSFNFVFKDSEFRKILRG